MSWTLRTIILLALAATLRAAPEDKLLPRSNSSATNSLGLWDADLMMEQATVNIARRYNLNQDQEDYTRQLLKTRTKEFLAAYEDELRGLLKELFVKQLSGEKPDAEKARVWGERAAPMLSAAKKAILDGNLEWRDILDDDQKKIHDIDLRLMDNNFKILENRFARWQGGDFQPNDWMGPAQVREAPIRTEPKLETSSRGPSTMQNAEDYWDIYVKKFILDYALDEAQKNSALAVLKDMREKVARVREKTEPTRKAAQEELHRLMREKADPALIKEASKRLQATQEPMSAMFDELKARLAKIPTEAQREKVEHDYISETSAVPSAVKEAPVADSPHAVEDESNTQFTKPQADEKDKEPVVKKSDVP